MKGTVYLLHFEAKYHHAQHYLGYTTRETVSERLEAHRRGQGARLMEVIGAAGIGWKCVRTWDNYGRADERRLKNWKKARQLCPVCRGEVAFEEV